MTKDEKALISLIAASAAAFASTVEYINVPHEETPTTWCYWPGSALSRKIMELAKEITKPDEGTIDHESNQGSTGG